MTTGPGPNPFPPTSRYAAVETTTAALPDGRVVPHLRRRLLPPADRFATLAEHEVERGDRLDNLAAAHLGDPEQWWRICDANGAERPDDLLEVGRRLRITLPEGVPGTPGAVDG